VIERGLGPVFQVHEENSQGRHRRWVWEKKEEKKGTRRRKERGGGFWVSGKKMTKADRKTKKNASKRTLQE